MSTAPTMSERDDNCVACGLEIPAGSRICSHCGSHQSRWRNEVLFASTLFGIASVTVTSIAFLISILPEVRSVLNWREEIEIVEFDGLGDIVLANRGDGPVYVSDVRTDVGPFSWVRRINAVIEARELEVYEPDSLWAAAWGRYGVPRRSVAAGFVRDSASSPLDADGCETILVVSESSPSYRLWASGMGDELPLLEDPAEVVIRFHGIETGLSYEDTLWMPAVQARSLDCV